MSTNIRVQRICEHCGNEFIAKTTRTKYCSHKCNSRAYKAKQKKEKIKTSNRETQKVIKQPFEELKTKEFLSINEVCQLIGISRRTVYRMIERGELNKTKIGTRSIFKRSDLDNLFNKPKVQQLETEPYQFNISDCYTINQVIDKYGISSGALYNLIKRNQIVKTQKGKNVYVSKDKINAILG